MPTPISLACKIYNLRKLSRLSMGTGLDFNIHFAGEFSHSNQSVKLRRMKLEASEPLLIPAIPDSMRNL
ncbi:hypothetical protein KOR42_13650 [Thalassoglobus neptunius]|uniref:Uncharacterized protein n=1 Tax=Thalassoglobus neptunius TaxID=1938619 RepID=A0A5C5X4E7_9PLAN|nr:hypothetical protein KOR42_13650 [Thalassoglobus neptunius]